MFGEGLQRRACNEWHPYTTGFVVQPLNCVEVLRDGKSLLNAMVLAIILEVFRLEFSTII